MAKTKAHVLSSSAQMEERLGDAIHGAERVLQSRWHKVEDLIRESPTAAVLIAAGLGHCMRRLPVRSLLATQLRLAWAFAPPALLAWAAAAAYQAIEGRFPQETKDGNARHHPAAK